MESKKMKTRKSPEKEIKIKDNGLSPAMAITRGVISFKN
jgi:hypothetical protein